MKQLRRERQSTLRARATEFSLPGALFRCFSETIVDIRGKDGLNFTVELQVENNGRADVLLGSGRRKKQNKRRGAEDAKGTERGKKRKLSKRNDAMGLRAVRDHCAPPLGMDTH
jgi:hypothetical protein